MRTISTSIIILTLAIVFMAPTCSGSGCSSPQSCGPSLAHKAAAKLEEKW